MSEMPERAALLASFEPDADCLLDYLRRRVDNSMLWDIAATDGDMGTSEFAAGLRPIRDFGLIPRPLRIEPREVLELSTYPDPDSSKEDPAFRGYRGHLMVSFASATLLRAAPHELERYNGWTGRLNHAVARLTISVLALDEEAQRCARKFLAWRLGEPWRSPYIPTEDREEEPFYQFALLVLSLRGMPQVPLPIVRELMTWLIHTEYQAAEDAKPEEERRFLLRCVSVSVFDEGLWIRLGEQLSRFAKRTLDESIKSDLLALSKWLTDPKEQSSPPRLA